ncbi:MAG: hypothetical protein ACETVR_01810 [Candidatus Bathyarchaeia archaeon]
MLRPPLRFMIFFLLGVAGVEFLLLLFIMIVLYLEDAILLIEPNRLVLGREIILFFSLMVLSFYYSYQTYKQGFRKNEAKA